MTRPTQTPSTGVTARRGATYAELLKFGLLLTIFCLAATLFEPVASTPQLRVVFYVLAGVVTLLNVMTLATAAVTAAAGRRAQDGDPHTA